jgi:hypothetical protein
MSALTSKRAVRPKRFTTISLAATPSVSYWQGGVVGFNTATGLVVKSQPLTTFWPIGLCVEDTVLGAGGGNLLIELFREVSAIWRVNDGTVVAASIGSLCYELDDQTVSNTDATNTLSVAGRVWAVDSVRGVLVEPVVIAVGDLSAIDS